MYLSECGSGEIVAIKRFQGDKRFVERMNAMGLYEGSKIRIIRHAPFKGPILIEDIKSSVRIMIGLGMAQKIEVGKE